MGTGEGVRARRRRRHQGMLFLEFANGEAERTYQLALLALEGIHTASMVFDH
jgi:hypothetical protein